LLWYIMGNSILQIEESSFLLTVVGKGWKESLPDVDTQHDTPPDSQVVVRVSGPEAGYVTTPIAMVQCACVLLKEITNDNFK